MRLFLLFYPPKKFLPLSLVIDPFVFFFYFSHPSSFSSLPFPPFLLLLTFFSFSPSPPFFFPSSSFSSLLFPLFLLLLLTFFHPSSFSSLPFSTLPPSPPYFFHSSSFSSLPFPPSLFPPPLSTFFISFPFFP